MHDYWVVNKTAVAKALEKFSDKDQEDQQEESLLVEDAKDDDS